MEKDEKSITIANNTFVGVQWDAQAIEAINTVALGLLNLTEIFKAQNINIEAMVKVEGGKLAELAGIDPDEYLSKESNNDEL